MALRLALWLLAAVGAVVHEEWDYRQHTFNISQLEVVGSEQVPVAGCPQEVQLVTQYRYDFRDIHGEVQTQNLSVATWQTILTEVFDGRAGKDIGVLKIQPHLNCMDQEDPELVRIIRSSYLAPPPRSAPYNLSLTHGQPGGWWGDGQARHLDQTFFHEIKKGGFFIEAGAYNGVSESTSLHFELAHQWSGLLVEPVPGYYGNIAKTGRRVWSVQTCLASKRRPETISFSADHDANSVTMQGRVADNDTVTKGTKMQCLPLYSLLLALGNPTVDFLSLDIEGPELEVLRTLPWDQVDIRSVSVETQFLSPDSRAEVSRLLCSQGFTHLGSLARDDLFVKLERGGSSPRQTVPQLLSRQHPRICNYFRVKQSSLATHCMDSFPRDYYWSQDVTQMAKCLRRDHCPWDFNSLLRTYTASNHWTNTLSEGCYATDQDYTHPKFRAPTPPGPRGRVHY